jgi:hypothetical protein
LVIHPPAASAAVWDSHNGAIARWASSYAEPVTAMLGNDRQIKGGVDANEEYEVKLIH